MSNVRAWWYERYSMSVKAVWLFVTIAVFMFVVAGLSVLLSHKHELLSYFLRNISPIGMILFGAVSTAFWCAKNEIDGEDVEKMTHEEKEKYLTNLYGLRGSFFLFFVLFLVFFAKTPVRKILEDITFLTFITTGGLVFLFLAVIASHVAVRIKTKHSLKE